MRRFAVLAVGLIAILAVVGSAKTRQDSKVVAAYGLSSDHVQLMRQCQQSFRFHHKHYNEAIGTEQGCACIAKRVGESAGKAQLTAAAAALHLLLYATETGGKETSDTRDRFGVDADAIRAHLPMSFEAFSYCGQLANHPGRYIKKQS